MPEPRSHRDRSSSESQPLAVVSHRASGLTFAAVGTTALALAIGAAVVVLPHTDSRTSNVAVAGSPRSAAGTASDTGSDLAAIGAFAAGQSADVTAVGATSDDTQLGASHQRREKAIRARLQPLVKDGTISAKQADAIAAELSQHPGLWRPGVTGLLRLQRLAVDVTAVYLHTSASSVRQQLRSGKSLAQIATASGKDTQGLVDALTARARTALDKAVVTGRLTQAQATRLEGRLPDLLTRLVDHTPRVRVGGTPGGPAGAAGSGDGSGDPSGSGWGASGSGSGSGWGASGNGSGKQPAPSQPGADQAGGDQAGGDQTGDNLPGLNQLLDAVSA